MKDKLIVLWISRDEEAAINMAFMYARNSKLKGWWNEVELIIWGPSAKVASENKNIQEELKELKNAGVNVRACKACADKYQVSERLSAMDIEVLYIGSILTDELKSGTKVITV